MEEPLSGLRENINDQLLKEYGRFEDGRPHFRVVWSNALTEKRWMTHTDEGFELLLPEVREVRKYSHINERYVLERLVPVTGETDLITKTSYEPAWTFQDRFGNYLSPRFDACKFIVEALMTAMGKKDTHVKYKDPNVNPEYRQQQIIDMEHYLFGEETPIGDALSAGDGISYAGMKDFNKPEETETPLERKNDNGIT
jgi:hypothetical protein